VDPGVALNQATAAIDSARSVSYDFTYEGHGSLAGHFTGSVKIMRAEAPGQGRVWITMQAPAVHGSKEDAHALTIAVEGAQITHVDEARKIVSRGSLQGGSAHLMGYAYYGVLFQFMQPEPFATELQDSLLAFTGTEVVHGVRCDRVKAANNSFGGADVTWSLGEDDRLPHAQTWEVTQEGVTGGFRFEIHNLDAAAPLTEADFTISVPAGYTLVDEDARNVAVGETAPDWALLTADGEEVRLSDLRGQVVVLDFWASWCTPCWQLMPVFDEVAGAFQGRAVRFLGVNAWESPTVDPQTYMKQKELSYDVLMHGEAVAGDYKIGSLPALFVIDAAGRIVYVNNPVMRQPELVSGELRQAIENALRQTAG
jgi:peroxiredoxin